MEINTKQAELEDNQMAEVLINYFSEPKWPRLKPRSFAILAALAFNADPLVGITSVSYDRIREMTGIGSNETVGFGIKELLDKGYLQVLDVGGSSVYPKVYRLLHHHLPGSEGRFRRGDGSDKICEILEEASHKKRSGPSGGNGIDDERSGH